jgi:trypsin-like peptidase
MATRSKAFECGIMCSDPTDMLEAPNPHSATRLAPLAQALLSSLAALGLIAALGSFNIGAGQAQAPHQDSPKFRLIRSVSGTKYEKQGGQFIIEDPRTVFSTAVDREIVVYFEWEGPIGNHHFDGRWRDPTGKVSVISSFESEAKQNIFGAYFELALAQDTPPGLWALEVSIDGEAAGTQVIQIQSQAPPAPSSPSAPVRRMLTPAEIYKSAVRSTVSLTKLGPDGVVVGNACGFFIHPDTILTSFDAIDGASAIRLTTPDGKSLSFLGVLSWNRLEDWATLRVASANGQGLRLASKDSWAVGDNYFSLDTSRAGDRSIVAGSISGTDDFPDVGKRLHLSLSGSAAASGAPILNDYGEVCGIMTYGSLEPGFWSLAGTYFAFPANLTSPGSLYALQNVLAVPIDVVQVPDDRATAHSLLEMKESGQFITPLSGNRNVSSGTLTSSLLQTGRFLTPTETNYEYSRSGGPMIVYINWQAVERIKSHISIRIYDLANSTREQSPAKKFDLSKNQNVTSTWKVDPSSFSPGLYRVDVNLDDVPVWRSYFRVVP